jgi:hypothetical protein
MSVPKWTYQFLARQGVTGLMSVVWAVSAVGIGVAFTGEWSHQYFTKATRCRLKRSRAETNLFWHHYGKKSIWYGHSAAT